jgi:hypothetical protein
MTEITAYKVEDGVEFRGRDAEIAEEVAGVRRGFIPTHALIRYTTQLSQRGYTLHVVQAAPLDFGEAKAAFAEAGLIHTQFHFPRIAEVLADEAD